MARKRGFGDEPDAGGLDATGEVGVGVRACRGRVALGETASGGGAREEGGETCPEGGIVVDGGVGGDHGVGSVGAGSMS